MSLIDRIDRFICINILRRKIICEVTYVVQKDEGGENHDRKN